ncbi:unnamed protein product [Meloidogyne enterolobii]|uniref:Uncharacterized protein n=3 Tax=Meloidogyne enterolobii TaxID=390850 RepID=A0ACB1AE54_MELEN
MIFFVFQLAIIKQDAMLVRNAVILLENEKESLRKAIRKLKLENGRMKLKIKTLNEKVGKLTNEKLVDVDDGRAPESEYDYDDLNRDFYLIGGIHGFFLKIFLGLREGNQAGFRN